MPLIGGDFVELRDCVFIKGFPSNCSFNISDVRKYFQEKVGECCVQMTALSKDKHWSFITLKFESSSIAENVIERFSGNYIYGHRVTMSYWRVPKNMTHSGRFIRNSHTSHSERWSDERSFDKETEKSSRYKDDFSRDKNFGTTNHMSRDTVSYNNEEQFSKDPDNFREYQESNFSERYTSNTSENFGYKEHWNSDGEGEGRYPIFSEDKSGWDSDYSVGNENFSDREYYADYERGEELPYAHEEDHWQEREVDHGRDRYFVDQDDTKDYESNLDEYDSYSEQYDYDTGHYGYNERPFEDTDEESSYTGSYRSEDLCATNRQWHDGRDYNNTQDSHARNQEYNRSSSPLLNETRQWPRWETIAPSNPTRRRLSDPDIITDTPKDNPWAQQPRTCNMTRELTDRRAPALLEERPHSDEWLRNTHRPHKDRGRRSASPVNFHPKVYSHRGSPLMDKNFKPSPEISYKTDHSNRGRNRIFSSRGRHSFANRGGGSRSSSTERSSDFTVHKTSPGRERSRKAFNEHGLEQRKKESRSYSPNPNAKVPLLRGRSHDGGRGGRRDVDLRRSLILHQQRKHSSLRQRDRDEGVKFSEGGSKTSPDKRDKPPTSHSTVESSTSTQSTNRKRHKCDGEKRRNEIETTKRRRNDSQNNSDNVSTHSDAENVIGDSNRSKRKKTASESRNRSSPNQKRKFKQKGEHVTDTSNTKRADRLLSDLAVTLAEGNISVRKPKNRATNVGNTVLRKSVDSEKGRLTKPSGQLEGTPHSERSCQGQRKTVSTVTENLPSVDTVEDVSCASETVDDWSNTEETPEGEITTPELNTSQLEVQSFVDSSDQDMENDAEFDSSNEFSEENFDYADEGAQSDDTSPENHDIFDIKKTCTFIVDDFEKTDEVEETNFESYSKVSPRKSEADFIAKIVDLDEGNSMQENCQYDQHTTTDESYEEPAHNSDNFTSSDQNEVKEKMKYTEKGTHSEVMSTNLQHVRMEISPVKENCTRPEVLPSQINVGSIEVSADALKQGSYNTEDHNCNNNGNMAVWDTEREQVDIHREKKQDLSKIDNGVDHPEINNLDKESYNIERYDLQSIDGKSVVTTDATYAVEEVPELEDTVNYFECEENGISLKEEAYFLEGAKVTQREVYDESDIDQVNNSKSEEYSVNDGEFYDTYKEQVCVEGGSVTQRKLYSQVGIGEDDNSDRKGDNMEDAMVDAIKLNGNVRSLKDEESNSEDVGFYALNKQQEVRFIKNKYVTGSVNNAKQKRHSLENFDFTSGEWKYNNKKHEAFNVEDSCVTQQEGYCSKNGNLSNVARNESRIARGGRVYAGDTEQKNHHLNRNSYNLGDQVNQTNVSNVNKTEDARCYYSSQGGKLNSAAAENNSVHGETRSSSWTGSGPCHSTAALSQLSPITDVDTVKTSASSLSNSSVSQPVKAYHNVVAEDLLQVDMEISSDEEHQDNFIGSSICVDTDINPIHSDGYRPYSPSSPTLRSDEQRSPLPKDDVSLYSPSHPTTVSEGASEVSITIEDVSYEDDKRERDTPICDTMDVAYPDNNSRKTDNGEEAKSLHFNPSIDGNSQVSTTTSTFRFSSSPKSGDGFTDVNFPTKDLTENPNVTFSCGKEEDVVGDSEVCKDSLKPLRCQTRTHSSPASFSMDTKPKTVYVTAAKTFDLYTYSGAQHKPRIFYATNVKSTEPVRSLSLDTALGKSWPLRTNSLLSSNNTSIQCEQQPTFDTISAAELEKKKEEKALDGYVELSNPDISFLSNAPLKTGKVTAQDGDQEVLKISTTSNSVKTDAVDVFPVIGPDNCINCGETGDISSVNKEPVAPRSNTDEETISLESASENNKSLFIQAPSETTLKDVPTDQSLTITDQSPSSITGKERPFVSNMSRGSGEIPVSSQLAVKKLLASACESSSFRLIDEGTSFPKISVHAESTVSEVESGNEKDVQTERFSDFPQLPDSAPCPANKRTHPDSTGEVARPSKIPRKPLKLKLPATSLSNRIVKRKPQSAYLGRCYKKTSTSTITRLTTDSIPDKHLSHGDVSAVTEQDSFNELSPTLRTTPTITDALLPGCPTGNTSPLTPQISPNTQTPTIENSTIREHTASEAAMDGRASSSSKESNWVALKMKRLQKKKEEIEQVYRQECRTVVNVVKMLVSNDPRLEGLLQNAVRRSLQEMGRRCVQELEKQARTGT